MERRPIVSGLVLSFLLPCLASSASAALFTGPFETVVARNPQSLSAGDLDGDGDLDLVVCHYSASLVTVLLNDGSGRFDQAVGSPMSGIPFPVSAVLGSFNPLQDGIPDLVVVGGTGFLRTGYLLYGDGAGGFQFQVSFGIGETGSIAGRQAAAPDFNGEGHDDIVFTSGQVRLGSGAGLVAWTELPLVRKAFEVTAGDFDGDGHSDAAFVSLPSVGRLQVFLSVRDTGDFVEAPGSPLEFGVGPETPAVTDLDGDGDPDLIVTDIYQMGTHVLLNQGGGRFVRTGFAPVRASYPRGLATADFDGDGHADAAVGSNNSSAISILMGDGQGRLREIEDSPLHVTGGVPISIVAGDLNGDGTVDLAAVDFQGSRIAVFLHIPPPVRDVPIDILPGSDDNVIRIGSQGVLPVAILSTADFDATTADPATVRLAGAPVHLGSSGAYACQPQEVDGDGRVDLQCKVDKAALQLHAGDTVAVLLAFSFDGEALRGQDAVRVLEGKAPHLPTTTRWPGAVIPVP